jgi:tRNA (guanine-N7-)-methyltransferase
VLDQLARVLVPGAELRLATDDPDYGEWMLLALLSHPDFEWTARGTSDCRVRPPDQPQTRYESKALAAGRRPLFLIARRR